MYTTTLLAALAFLSPAWANPIDQAVLAVHGAGLQSASDHPHPILDKYVEKGIFEANDISEDISEAWKLLESNVDAGVIEAKLKRLQKQDKLETIAPQSSTKKNENLIESLTYDHVTLEEFDTYSLRVKKDGQHKASDPASLGVDTVNQYTGYFDINEEDKHLFFWFFESRNDPANDPVILWLNGGPGCSSMTGLFFELGPSSINGTTLTPVNNPFSWNTNASVIFLEQPVGVGYSYAEHSSVSSTKQAADDVFAFLQLFFARFDSFAHNDFHIAGESYAGHYIPNIASVIVNHEDRSFDLTSVLIGNGITDPLIQYYHYIPMACNATESGYRQLISDEQCESLEEMYPRCASLISNCYKSQNALTCFPANLYCERMMGPFEKTGLNYYDIRKPCLGDGCYPQMASVDAYLNKPEVMEALGSEVTSYVGCDNQVFRDFLFSGDEPKPFQQYIAEILELDVPVLIYAGDKDYICNWLGNRAWVDALEWEESESYANATTEDWIRKIDGGKAGTVRSNGKLTFARVYDAGHMVPFDQPESSLDMVNRWIGGDFYFTD